MADSEANSVKSPIIMKVDGPAEDNVEEENEANERAENNSIEIKPSQVCSPGLSRPVLGASRLGNVNPFNTLSNTSNSILRPSQLSSTSNSSSSNNRSNFLLNPSRLNPFANVSKDDTNDEGNKVKNNVSHTNGDSAVKFVPLLNTETKISATPAQQATPATPNFVFGQNLQERVIADGKLDEPKPSTSINTNGATDMLFTNAIGKTELGNVQNREPKSLSESAREYEESRAVKRKYDEVEVKTGEEGETNIVQVSCKLFTFDKNSGNWQERGRGNLRLNDQEIDDGNGSYTQSRLVFRTSGSLRVVLNTKIWAEMTVEEASKKSIRLTAIDSNGEIKVFLIMASKDDIHHLFNQLDIRVKKEIERQKHKNDTVEQKSTERSPKKPNIDSGGN